MHKENEGVRGENAPRRLSGHGVAYSDGCHGRADPLCHGRVPADSTGLEDSRTIHSPALSFAMYPYGWRSQYNGPIQLDVYGDATGNGRSSSAARTDWQIVKDAIAAQPHRFVKQHHVPSVNPPVRDRVNCVNALLCNSEGDRRLTIDPRCQQLILDLERVRWRTDVAGNAQGELDKSDPARTHVSDALGYMIAREFNIRSKTEIYGSGILM